VDPEPLRLIRAVSVRYHPLNARECAAAGAYFFASCATTSGKTSVPSARTAGKGGTMCRNIKTLFNFEPPATDDEIKASSLQFVRKLSGFTSPSKANQAAFDRAVQEVAAAARALIVSLVTTADPRDREIEAARAKAKSIARFGASS
jgi:hypothetical protein